MTDLTEPLPIGTPVRAYPGVRPDEFPAGMTATELVTTTRSEVWMIGETLVVKVDGYAGGIALTHIDRL